MHAYLIVGNDETGIVGRIETTAKKLGAKILEFSIQKIENTRELLSFVSLRLTQPTAILIKDVNTATPEALNAFLKNLEEPQENLYYILTAKSAKSVLPTIVSRCQVISINSSGLKVPGKEAEKFLGMTTAKKIIFLDKFRKREEAGDFVETLIAASHQKVLQKQGDYLKIAGEIDAEKETLKALKANGNVRIQLTNLAILLAN